MNHPLWPLIKKATEEEITGKLPNEAWEVVERPIGVHVLKSRWVFAVKYDDKDGSIKVVEARFSSRVATALLTARGQRL